MLFYQCDNCRHPKERQEAKDEAVTVLKAIRQLDERFATEYIVQIITGKLTPQIQMFRHESLEAFASGNDRDAFYWTTLLRQMLLAGLLVKDIEEYGVI
jgi:ATP-dependent DNA helicase RecQ